MKITKILIPCDWNTIFCCDKKFNSLEIKGYIIAKNNILAEVTFKIFFTHFDFNPISSHYTANYYTHSFLRH